MESKKSHIRRRFKALGDEEAFSATPLQLSMLYGRCVDAGVQPYLQQFRWFIREKLEAGLFRKAWEYVLSHYDVFFYKLTGYGEGQIYFTLSDSLELTFEVRDLCNRGVLEASHEVERFRDADFSRGLDPGKDDLCRFRLFLLPDRQAELVWTSHHALFDGRSRLVILKYVHAVYRELLREGTLPEIRAVPFNHFLKWYSRKDFSVSLNYWKGIFKSWDGLQTLAWRSAEKPLVESSGVDVCRVELPGSLVGPLRVLSENLNVSLNVIFQSAWALMLSRIYACRNVVFGAPRACRQGTMEGVNGSVGMFLNMVPVFIEVSERLTISEFIGKCGKNWLELRSHEHCPLSKIQALTASGGSLLFNSLLGYERYELNDYAKRTEGWGHYSFNLKACTDIPLVLQFSGEENLVLEANYHCKQFDEGSIEPLCECLFEVLGKFSAEPDATIGDVCLVSKSKERLLLETAKGKGYASTDDTVIRFENIVNVHKESPAVWIDGDFLTYGELNMRANQLARFLRESGLNKGERVAIFMDRCPFLPVALFGVLKAGAAYIPIDVDYPEAGMQTIFEDADPHCILSVSKFENRNFDNVCPCLYLDQEWERIRCFPAMNLGIEVGPEEPAYLCYTSGSSGVPKAAIIPHRGILRLVVDVNYVDLSADSRILQVAALSFDATTFEIWGALLNGGMCVFYPGDTLNVNTLSNVIRQRNINTMFLTTALFNYIIREEPSVLEPLAQLLFGGETVSVDSVEEARRRLPNTELIHCYGPTENTTFSLCYRIPKERKFRDSVPIGKPVQGTSAYVLDTSLHLLPEGVVGELYLGGAGVGLGYWNRPELNVKNFIRDPFEPEGSGLLYKTGDKVYLRSDGLVEFIGRMDKQVKIRGFRIEPGAIQAHLLQCSGVVEAYVRVLERDADFSSKELIAYVVLEKGSKAGLEDLRYKLSESLPSYMVPGKIISIDIFPLTLNGKVDESKLPVPKREVGHGIDIDDLDETQAVLWDIWKAVLGCVPRDLETSFFEMGGHSLAAIQMLHRMEKHFGVSLSLDSVYDNASFEGLARFIDIALEDTSCDDSPKVSVAPLTSGPRRKRYPGTWDMEFQLRFQRDFSDRAMSLITRGFFLEGEINRKFLEESINKVFNQHEILRSCLELDEGKIWLRVEESVPIPLSYYDFSSYGERVALEKAEALFASEAKTAFDLLRLPLGRVVLIQVTEKRFMFLFSCHHIVCDGHGLCILFKEVSMAYAALLTGGQCPLQPERFTHMDEFYGRQKWLESGGLKKLTAFWEKKCQSFPLVSLPIEEDCRLASVVSASVKIFEVPKELHGMVSRFCGEHLFSLFGFYFSVFKLLLARYCGSTDIPLGTFINSRLHEEADEIIGNFGGTIYVRESYDDTLSVIDILKILRGSLSDALDHKFFNAVEFSRLLKNGNSINENQTGGYNFALDPDNGESLSLPGIRVSKVPRREVDIDGKLHLYLQLRASDAELRFFYPPELFVDAAIDRLAFHYESFIQQIMDDASQKFSDMADLSDVSEGKRPLSEEEIAGMRFREL